MGHSEQELHRQRERRRVANLRILKRYLRPKIHELLSQPRQAQSYPQVIGAFDDGSLNVMGPQGPLFAPNAITAAYNQVQDYIKSPFRILFDTVEAGDNNRTGAHFIHDFNDRTGGAPTGRFDGVAGNLVSFGCGLGLHIPLLMAEYTPRNLIVVEPVFDLFDLSLDVLDWAPVVEAIEGRGGNITFLFADDPDAAARLTVMHLRDRDYGLIEGTVFYQHHAMGGCDAIARKVIQSRNAILAYNGWIEDELIHLNNHSANCSRASWKTVTQRQETLDDCPALLVGSGPSLADDIDLIRDMADRCVVFSCGTGLRALLAAGIRPDFHVEMENAAVIARVVADTAAEFGLSDITLLASTTVDPGIPALFDDVAFFHRDGDALIHVLRGDCHQFQHSGRTVSNSAIAMAHALGFDDIRLFGIDMGARDPQRHHVEDTVYYKGQTDLKEELGQGTARHSFDITIPGNFRETIATTELYVFMLQGIQSQLDRLREQTPDLRVRNCSDGAFIPETEAVRARDLEFPDLARSKADILDNVRFRFVPVDGPDRLGKTLGDLTADFADWFQGVLDCLEARMSALAAGDFNRADALADLNEALSHYLVFDIGSETLDARALAVRSTMSGSVLRLLHIFRQRYDRTPRQAKEAVFEAGLQAMANALISAGARIAAALEQAGYATAVTAFPRSCQFAVEIQQFVDLAARNEQQADSGFKAGDAAVASAVGCEAARALLAQGDRAGAQRAMDALLDVLPGDEALLCEALDLSFVEEDFVAATTGEAIDADCRAVVERGRGLLAELKAMEVVNPRTAALCYEVSLTNGDYQSAFEWALKESELLADAREAAWHLATALLLGRATEDALSLFRGACRDCPATEDERAYAALAEYVAGNETEAIETWHNLTAQDSKAAAAFLAASGNSEDSDAGPWEDAWRYRLARHQFDHVMAPPA